jgi:NADH dehydrogenase FAD-containing subunit
MKVKSLIARPKVVVIGGSFAGLCTIRHLKKYSDLDVTLIDPKDYFEYTPGVLHLLAGSNADLISPLETITKDAAAVLQGKFIGINKNPEIKSINVQLLDSTGHAASIAEIAYDAMIICSGVSYIAPIRTASIGHTLAKRLIEVEDYKLKLRNATRVIVAGGGLVGVELAAEISIRLEKQVKEVILISRTTLLNTLPESAGNFALNWFKTRKNVRLVLGDELISDNSLMEDKAGSMTSYKTVKGETLQGDLYIDCTG